MCTDGRAGVQTCSTEGTLSACACGPAGDAATDAADATALDVATMDARDANAADTREASTADAPADATDANDATDVADVTDVHVPGPGEVGAMCTRNADCNSGLCLANGHCSQTCSSTGDCIAGWQCGPLPGVGNLCQCSVTRELCDGQDNDCDGVIDNNASASCAPGQVCQAGACVCPPANVCSSAPNGCADFASDPSNCGMCGSACPGGISCTAGRCNCPSNGIVCNGACADVQTDRNNCGMCGMACPGAQLCVAGQCACPTAGDMLCSGACVNTQTDARNCGGCGTTCAVGGSCSAGNCVCPGAMGTACNGTCYDLASDVNHCGSCANACAAGASCANGTCTCPGTRGTVCNGACHDLATDVNNCGACANACAAGATCSGGSCMCPGTRGSVCNGACHDLATDVNNCGACGTVCPAGGSCANGACTCPGGLMACGTVCTNVTTDAAHCGSCTNACPAGIACSAGMCVAPAPRQIAPLSTALVTSQRPTFHVQLAPGTDGVRVEICRDRACATVEQTVDGTGPAATPATALGAGVHYWRAHGRVGSSVGAATTAVWEFRVGARSAPVDTSWGTFVDVNGDGYADALVGASGSQTTSVGAAYLYLGSAAGLSTTPIALANPTGAPGRFGLVVASAGDVNGDGFGDAMISAPNVGFNTGQVYVYLGGPSGLAATPATTLNSPDGGGSMFGVVLSSAGDVDGDGYADIAVSTSAATNTSYVFRGGPTGVSTTPAKVFGPATGGALSIASAGDMNGDGYGDVAVVGSAGTRVFLGSATGLSATPVTLSLTGGALSLDDTNGDGYADLGVVSSSFTGSGYSYSVMVFRGGSTVSTTPAGSGPNYYTSGTTGGGLSLANAGDLNGDGFPDFMAGIAPVSGTTGSVQVNLGTGSGYAATTTIFPPAGAVMGYVVAGAGDTNGDGLADILVKGFQSGNIPYVYLYRGALSGTGIMNTPATALSIPGDTTFGQALALLFHARPTGPRC